MEYSSGITAMLEIVDMFIMSESDLARPFIDLSAFTLQNIPLKLMLFVFLFIDIWTIYME